MSGPEPKMRAADIPFFVVPIVVALIVSRLIGGDWNWGLVIFIAPIGAAAVWGQRERRRRQDLDG